MTPHLRAIPQRVCVECPAYAQGALVSMVGNGKGQCAFQSIAVESRDPLPQRWFDDHAVVFVRRGIGIRQRIDSRGRASAVDAVGPGTLFTVSSLHSESSTPTGYAATRTIACVCSRDTFDAALAREDVMRDYVRLQALALERVERLAESRARTDAASAVATLLCCLADTLTGAPTDLVPSGLQQRDLAALVGLRHETVCRVMKAFEAEQLVAREPAGFRILDRQALEEA